MRSGWTGGQFSIWRAGLAITALADLLPGYRSGKISTTTLPSEWLLIVIVVASTSLLLGWFARPAAIILIPLAVLSPGDIPVNNLPLTLVLALFLVIQPGPFGSLKARGRQDPGGNWSLDPLVRVGTWFLWIGLFFVFHLNLSESTALSEQLQSMPLIQKMGCGLVLVATPFALVPFSQRFSWVAMFLTQLTLFAMGTEIALWPAVWLLILVADPQWLSAKTLKEPAMVFYDGSCGLCHRSCRFLLAEDLGNKRFQFSPIGGPTFQELTQSPSQDPLPDSILVRTQNGNLLSEFAAVRHLLNELGGFWRVLSWGAQGIPRGVGNVLYRFIARNRQKLFAKPSEACPVLPPHLRQLFHA